MWRIVCKGICLLTACGLLLGAAAGCSRNPNSRQKRLFERGIVTDNNLTINRMELQNGNITSDYLAIDGLHDQAIEEKINRRIQAVSDEMHSGTYVPPYRGIAVKIRQNQDHAKEHFVYMFTEFNSNNILSVSAHCYTFYQNDNSDDALSYTYQVSLNFDLTTGEELTLKDLFAPGTDYIELINRQVDEYLMANGYDNGIENIDRFSGDEIALTAPFQSITPEQKFYISYNGNLCLLMDYDTPFIYTGFNPLTMVLDSEAFGDSLMLFRDIDQPIFDANQTVCQLMETTSDNRVNRQTVIKPNTDLFGEYYYRDNTPDAVLAQLETVTFDEAQRPFDFNTVYHQVSDLFADENWRLNVSCYMACHATKSPDYFGFHRNYMLYASPDDAWTSENSDPVTYFESYETAYTFDKDGNLLTLSSLFVQPEHISELLEKAMLAHLSRELTDEKHPADVMSAFVKQLIPHINGVCVQSNGLYITFDLPETHLKDMIRQFFGDVENEYLYHYGVSELSYSDLGCDNLVMFRDAGE